ncbi:MAG TPA: MFS transporter [Steroidobacteraceae bacterium]|jgi:MFS family permease|nr:MFS transporter [Steroidobacteraceae bacterium]
MSQGVDRAGGAAIGEPASPLRWLVLVLAALAVCSSYYEDDVIGPIADLLHRQRGFTQSQLGMLNGIISIPNALLAVISGILIDRYGPARVALWSAAIGVVGAALTAIGVPYGLMVVGRFVFGVSEGSIFIALIAGLAQWFPRSGIALATSFYLSLARVGSYSVDTSTAWASPLYERGWQPPLWLGTVITAAGLAATAVYFRLDRRRKTALAASGAGHEPAAVRRHRLDFDLSYWYILGLHVLYAAVFFPFRTTYAIEYFQHAKGLSLADAGVANSWVFFAAVFATPIFGLVADRFGHRSLMLALGTVLLPLTFLLLGLTNVSLWVSTALMGISFSLVPAVIWPATTLIVEPRRLGIALGLITLIQALAMALSNLAAGWLADRAGAGAANPQGYGVMLVFFFVLSIAALISALLLWAREAGPRGHGLEARDPA